MTRLRDADARSFRPIFKLMPKGISLVMVGDNQAQFSTKRVYNNLDMSYTGGGWMSPPFSTIDAILEWLRENY